TTYRACCDRHQPPAPAATHGPPATRRPVAPPPRQRQTPPLVPGLGNRRPGGTECDEPENGWPPDAIPPASRRSPEWSVATWHWPCTPWPPGSPPTHRHPTQWTRPPRCQGSAR